MPLHSSPHPSIASSGSVFRRQPLTTKTNTLSRLGSPSPAGAAQLSDGRSGDLKPKAHDFAHPSKVSSASTSTIGHPLSGRKLVRGRGSSSQASSTRAVGAGPKRTRRDGTRRDDPSPAPSSAQLALNGHDNGQRTREVTPVILENDLFGFGASLALTQQSQSSLRRTTPSLSFSQQAAVGLSDPLSDLPSTPSTHRAPSEPSEAENRIDMILGRKRRASTPKTNGNDGRSDKRLKRSEEQRTRRGKGTRRSIRTRANDAEPESEDGEEEEDVMEDVPSPSPPQPEAENLKLLLPGQDNDDEVDPDATIRSRTPTAKSTAPESTDNALVAPRAKSRSPSLASDDFYS